MQKSEKRTRQAKAEQKYIYIYIIGRELEDGEKEEGVEERGEKRDSSKGKRVPADATRGRKGAK